MGKPSRNKGKRGEREVATLLREAGHTVRRGWQSRSGSDEADVIGLPGWWIEVGFGRTIKPRPKLAQACEACGPMDIPVAITRGGARGDDWIVTMRLSDWIESVVPVVRAKAQAGRAAS